MTSSPVPYMPLNDGNRIPQIGLGTWKQGKPAEFSVNRELMANPILSFLEKGSLANAVYLAIKCGYRHIDTAYIYQNETEVGEGIERAIKEGLVKREDLFVTTKCWLTYLRKDRVERCLRKSLQDLKLDYVDLYLIHWPMAFKQTDESNYPENSNGLIDVDETIDLGETWTAFEALKKLNLVRSLGVSNFNSTQLQRLLASCSIKPAVNQIECHPYLNQDALINFCHKNEIRIISYCPLGSTPPTSSKGHSSNLNPTSPRLLDDPVVKELAKKYHKSEAQILIRYHIKKQLIVIPKSTNEERIKQNLQVFDFELEPEDMARLTGLNKPYRYCTFDLKGLDSHKEYPFKEEPCKEEHSF